MKYFGTDGIRGRAEMFTPEFVDSIAYAAASNSSKIIIARDTRVSGERIEALLADGLTRRGVNIVFAGIIPTPVLAYHTRISGAQYGIMITASHNPSEYNGIKFFSPEGAKLTEDAERCLESLINDYGSSKAEKRESCGHQTDKRQQAAQAGIRELADAVSGYLQHIKCALNPDIKGLRVLLDTANGAAARVAPFMFSELGAQVSVINDEVNGRRINENCGAAYPDTLINAMAQGEYDIGFTYDGDGDRVMAVKDGKLLDGDRLLYAAARYFQERGMLRVAAAVGTVMTNLGAEQAFLRRGIRFIRASVGDKNVAMEMKKHNCCLGGEASGHLIFTDYQNTGDGLLSSILIAEIDKKRGLLALDDIQEYPQVSDDIITVPSKIVEFRNNKEIDGYLKTITKTPNLRTVVRVSGTEPRIRIMVEAPSRERAAHLAAEIKNYILARI
ncbi:MAG: phosphoglucosamine mutase [Clostridia bacterium]